MTTNFYTVQDFKLISTSSTSKHVLSQTILGAIATLEKSITSVIRDVHETTNRTYFSESSGYDNNYDSTSRRKPSGEKRYGGNSHSPQDFEQIRKSSYNGNSGSTARQPISSDDWTTVRSFKTTKLETKVGVDKDINDIRTFLNKISNKNYDKQKNAILEHISEFAGKDSNSVSQDTDKIAKFIFDIASTNKFFSEIYADLYSALIVKFAIFSDILDNFIKSYKFMDDTIAYIDPSEDYDGFCLYTKQNDKRKAIASFIVMLMNRGVISKECVADIIQHFLDIFTQYIEEDGRDNDIEEFADVIFVFVTLGKDNIDVMECWTQTIFPKIAAISKMKPRMSRSLTNRAIFKFMDIMDKIK